MNYKISFQEMARLGEDALAKQPHMTLEEKREQVRRLKQHSTSFNKKRKTMNDRAQFLQQSLSLLPHPEGGFYSEIFRSTIYVQHNASPNIGDGRGKSRSALTSIYFLLTRGDVSRWHVVDADETWHYYEGDAVELYIMPPDFSSVEKIMIGTYSDGVKPTHVVPAGWWQASRSSGEYTLVGCTVAPAFEFEGFRMLNDDEKTSVREKYPELVVLA